MKSYTRWITATAVGIALFTVFSLVLRIPVFASGHFYICLGYIVMGIFCYYYGILSGTLIGVLGILFYCLITSSLGGMVGWMLGNAVIGVCVGLVGSKTREMKNELLHQALLIGVGILSTALGMLLVKAVYESLLSGLPFSVRFVANMTGFITDAIVLSVSFPFAFSLRKVLPKWFTAPAFKF